MKLRQIDNCRSARNSVVNESLADFNARIDLANMMRRDIATGELSLAQIARKYRVSKARISVVKKQMMAAGWMPGQPLPDTALSRPRTPSQAPPPKYPGMSRAEINRAQWNDPEFRAKMMTTRQSPEYRELQRGRANAFWMNQDQEAGQQRTAEAIKARRKPKAGDT